MNPTKLKLTNPTDEELSDSVAEHVAKALPPADDEYVWAFPDEGEWLLKRRPPYSTSADAVLPLLERYSVTVERVCYESWEVCIEDSESDDDGRDHTERGEAPTFPRAVCIALCRANGIEVEQTAQPTRASS